MTILRCPRCGKITGKFLNLQGNASIELQCRSCRELTTFEVTQAPDGRLILRTTGDGFHSASVSPPENGSNQTSSNIIDRRLRHELHDQHFSGDRREPSCRSGVP
jgi:phage FluMu protein Com